MLYVTGIAISVLSIVFSIFHLKQSPAVYLDFIALAVVIGGTVAVAIMTLPWEHKRQIINGLKSLFAKRERNLKEVALESFAMVSSFVENGRRSDVRLDGVAGSILGDGAELIELGFKTDRTQAILEERIHQATTDAQYVANAFRSLAKYPPAFGLVGTVLSLVSVMRAVSTGATAQETGMRMAVALVATFYGLLVANLFVSPAGEAILKNALEEKKEAEIALQAILLASERVSLLEAQEMLNSFVPRHERISMITGYSSPSDESSSGKNESGPGREAAA